MNVFVMFIVHSSEDVWTEIVILTSVVASCESGAKIIVSVMIDDSVSDD